MMRRLPIARRTVPVIVGLAAVVALLSPGIAFAYVDPSIVTYAIQSLAAIIVALSAVVGVAFRRTRKAIFRLFGIDENAGKTVEPDVRPVYSERGCNDADAQARRMLGKAAESVRVGGILSWRSRLWRAAIVAVFFVYTIFIVAPFELLIGNVSELTLGISLLWQPIVAAGIVMAVCLALAMSAFRGKAFAVVLAVVAALAIAAYMQAMLMNGGLPAADGHEVDWSAFTPQRAGTLLVWAVILIGAVWLGWRSPKRARAIGLVVAVLLIIVQTAGLGSLVAENAASRSRMEERMVDILPSEEGMLDVSAQDNVIVIVLDTMDTDFVFATLIEYPQLLDQLKGFTFYTDSSGSFIPTRYGIPSLLSGVTIQPNQDPMEYFTETLYSETYLLDLLNEAGYDVGIYSPRAAYSPETMSYLSTHTKNYNTYDEIIDELPIDDMGIVCIMYKAALFRDLPWVAKPALRYYTDDINAAMLDGDVMSSPEVTPYVEDDAALIAKLRQRGLSIDDSIEGGAFRFFHLQGAHGPWTLGTDGKPAKVEGNMVDQIIGSFCFVNDYLNELRRLGVYDDATIIVTADHGWAEMNAEYISHESSPVMLVKPSQNAKQAAASLRYEYTMQVSQWDVNPTLIDAIGYDSTKYPLTGISIWRNTGASRVRYFLHLVADTETYEDFWFREYRIDGNAVDLGSYTFTGRQWDLWYRDFAKAF